MLMQCESGAQVGGALRIGGWVRTGREAGAGAFAFLEVSDGSCFGNMQARVPGYCPLLGRLDLWKRFASCSKLGLGCR